MPATLTRLRETSRPGLRLECPCDHGATRAAVRRLRAFLEEAGLAEGDVASLEMALAEAANNAVEHAVGDGRRQPIVLEAVLADGAVELRVTDHTPGFDWPERAALPELEAEGGRGLFIMQAIATRAAYLRGREENCLVLSVRCPIPAAPPAAQATIEALELELSGMTEELGYSYETLSAIFRYSSELGSAESLQAFTRRLLADLAAVTEADLAVLRLATPDGTTLTLERSHPEGLSLADEGTAVEAEAAFTQEDVWFGEDRPLQADDPLRATGGLAFGLCHPLLLHGRLLGTLTLGRRPGGAPFRAGQVSVLHTLAEFLSLQLGHERLAAERLQARLGHRELEIAAGIQRSLLPRRLPPAAPFLLAAQCQSARQVGGDFYDALPVGQDGLLLVIADVMGKGVPAALFAATLRSVLRALPQHHADPARLLAEANAALYEDFDGANMFATAAAAFLDRGRRTLVAANAGHCPLLVWPGTERRLLSLESSGPPLGVLRDSKYLSETVRLPPGSRVLLYTDGVTEQAAPDGEMFGEERMRAWVARTAPAAPGAAEWLHALTADLRAFQGAAPVTDDQTLLAIANP